MTRLLKLKPADDSHSRKTTIIDPVIQQCHERLLRNDYGDSLDVRIALLADMVFRIYALNTTNANQR